MSKRKRGVRRQDAKPQRNTVQPNSSVHKRESKQKRQKVPRAPQSTSKASAQFYNDSQQILCVGEGNFSFARALVRLFESSGDNLVATAYDSGDTVKLKYEEGSDPVSDIVTELTDCGARVLYNVDATDLGKSLQRHRKKCKQFIPLLFDIIIFNFPHVGLGIKDQDVNIRKNQQMLSSFFFSACSLLKPDGEIRIALKTGKPYSMWNITSLAHHSTQGALTLRTSQPFLMDQYPGYSHRRTLGYREGLSSTANEDIGPDSKTYIFGFSRRLQ